MNLYGTYVSPTHLIENSPSKVELYFHKKENPSRSPAINPVQACVKFLYIDPIIIASYKSIWLHGHCLLLVLEARNCYKHQVMLQDS